MVPRGSGSSSIARGCGPRARSRSPPRRAPAVRRRRMASRRQPPAGARNRRPAAPFANWIVSPSEQEHGVGQPVERRAQGALLGLERARCAHASVRAASSSESASTCRSPGTSGTVDREVRRRPCGRGHLGERRNGTRRRSARPRRDDDGDRRAPRRAAASPMRRDRAATASISVNGCDTRSATGSPPTVAGTAT